MALTSANVRVAPAGAVYMGPTTADAPTSPTSVLDVDLVELGYFSEDGVSEARDRSTEDIKGHTGTIIRTIITESSATFTVTLMETNEQVIELFYGADVTKQATYGYIDVDPSATGGRRAFVIDTIDGSEIIRTWIPQGELSEVGEVKRSSQEAIAYEVTIKAYPSSTINDACFRNFYSQFAS